MKANVQSVRIDHSPIPWKVAEDHKGLADIVAADGTVVVWTIDGAYGSQIEANADFIVQAVNAHESLLAACKLALVGEADDDTIFNALADAVAKAERKEVTAL